MLFHIIHLHVPLSKHEKNIWELHLGNKTLWCGQNSGSTAKEFLLAEG
jgi:hypothetical protein